MSFSYLAGPYYHVDEAVRIARYEAHRRECISWVKIGVPVFSPIVHSHNLLPEMEHYKHIDWLRFDLSILKKASRLIVLQLEGWDRSYGTQMEIAAAIALDMPIILLKPTDGTERSFLQAPTGEYLVRTEDLGKMDSALG